MSTGQKLLLNSAVVVFVAFLVLASVPFWGHCWQLVNGNEVSFAGWKAHLPPGFYETSEGGPSRHTRNSRHFWRNSFGMPIRKGPYGHITLFRYENVMPQEKFHGDVEFGFVQVAQSQGYALVEKKEIRVADTRAHCFEFERSGKQPEFAVRCAVENSLVWPWYSGAREHVPAFYAMVEGMTRTAEPVR